MFYILHWNFLLGVPVLGRAKTSSASSPATQTPLRSGGRLLTRWENPNLTKEYYYKQIWFCLPCQSLIGIKSAGNSEIGSLSTFWCRYIYSLMMTQWSHKSKGKVQGQNKLQIAVNWENKLTIQMRKRNLRSITEARVQVSEHSSKKMRRLEKMIALGRKKLLLMRRKNGF